MGVMWKAPVEVAEYILGRQQFPLPEAPALHHRLSISKSGKQGAERRVQEGTLQTCVEASAGPFSG